MKCFFIILSLFLSCVHFGFAQTLAVVTQEPRSSLYSVDADNQTVEELYRERLVVDLAADPISGDVYAYDANREELIALSDAGEEVLVDLTGIDVKHLTNGPDGELYLTTSSRDVYRYDRQLDSFYVLQGIETSGHVIASENYLVFSGPGRRLTKVDRNTLANPLVISTTSVINLGKGAGIDTSESFLYYPNFDVSAMVAFDINDVSAPLREIPISIPNVSSYQDACSTADGDGLLFSALNSLTLLVYRFDYNTEQISQIPRIGYAFKIATTEANVISYMADQPYGSVFEINIATDQRIAFVTDVLYTPRHLKYDPATQNIYILNKTPFFLSGSISVYNRNTSDTKIPIINRLFSEDDPNTFDLDASGAPIIGVSPAGLRRLPCDTCQLDTIQFTNIPEPDDVEFIAVDPDVGNIYYTTRAGLDLHRRLPSGEDEFIARIDGMPGFRDHLHFAPNPARLISLENSSRAISVYNIDSGTTTSYTIDPSKRINSIALDPLDNNKLYAILASNIPGTEELYEIALNTGISNLLMPLPFGSIALTVIEGSPGVSSSTTTPLVDDLISAYYVPEQAAIRLSIPKRTSAVSLIDAKGQLLQQLTPSENLDIDIALYPSGVYILSVVIDGEVLSKKVIKP